MLSPLDPEQRKKVRARMIELVLATDLATLFPAVAELKTLAAAAPSDGDGGTWRSPLVEPADEPELRAALQNALRWADLSHTSKPRTTHIGWTERVYSEVPQADCGAPGTT